MAIDFNKLAPIVYSIGTTADNDDDPTNGTGVDLGVAQSMLIDDIRYGCPKWPGSNGPDGYAYNPDWAALKAEFDADIGAVNKDYNEMRAKMQNNYKELCDAWRAKDYDKMVEIMEKASTKNQWHD